MSRLFYASPAVSAACRVTLFAALLLPVSCVAPNPSSAPEPTSYAGMASEWPDDYRAIASKAWLFAQMSVNAYQRPLQFVLPDSVRTLRSVADTSTGFAAVIYEIRNRTKDSVASIVIAFRGTDGPHDFIDGNFGWTQNRQAEELYADVRHAHPNVPIIVTGHSLGGALSLQVSTRNASVTTYVFNSSYHIHNSLDAASDRYSIAEAGEVLVPLRVLLRNPTISHLPYFNCMAHGGPIARHSGDALAWCVTSVAAFSDEGAQQSIRRNSAMQRLVVGTAQLDTLTIPDSSVSALSPVPLKAVPSP